MGLKKSVVSFCCSPNKVIDRATSKRIGTQREREKEGGRRRVFHFTHCKRYKNLHIPLCLCVCVYSVAARFSTECNSTEYTFGYIGPLTLGNWNSSMGAPLVAFRLYTISPRGKKRYIEGRGDISRYKILLPPLRERSRPLFHFVTPRAHSREAFNGDFNTFLQTNWSIGYYRTTSGALQSTGEASPPSPRSHDQSTILKNSRRNIEGKKTNDFCRQVRGRCVIHEQLVDRFCW